MSRRNCEMSGGAVLGDCVVKLEPLEDLDYAHCQNELFIGHVKPKLGPQFSDRMLEENLEVERDDLFTNLTCGEEHDDIIPAKGIKVETDPLEMCDILSCERVVSNDSVQNVPSDILKRNSIKRNISQSSKGMHLTNTNTNNLLHTDSPLKVLIKEEPTETVPILNHKCSFCEETFDVMYELTLHQRIHTGERAYNCSLCEKTFTRSGALKNHEKAHMLKQQRKSMREEILLTSDASVNQEEENHNKVEHHKCSFCFKTFIYKFSLEAHERVHRGEDPFQCSFCQKSLSSSEGLKTHERIHTVGKGPYECSFCDSVFTSSTALTKHEKLHTMDEHLHQCSLCPKSFLTSVDMKIHRASHTEQETNKCSDYQKSVEYAENLKSQGKIHTGEKLNKRPSLKKTSIPAEPKNEKTKKRLKPGKSNVKMNKFPVLGYKCSFCDYNFPSSTALKIHEKVHAPPIELLKCSYCDATFEESFLLNIHEKHHVLEETRFKCSVCEKVCTSLLGFKSHQRIHKEINT